MTDQHPTYLEPSELGTKDYWETYYARTLSHLSSRQPAPNASTSTSTSTNTNKPGPHNPNPASSTTDAESDEESSSSSDDDEVDDDSDPGTSWFSEHNAPAKVLAFLTDEAFPLAPCHTHTLPAGGDDAEAQTGVTSEAQQHPSILDLGTGNGSMLALLRKRGGFRGDMVGVDYSAQSVELARRLQALRIHRAYLSDSEEEEEEDDDEGEGEDKAATTNIRFEEWDILSSSSGAGAGAAGVVAEGLAWFPYERQGFDIVLDKGTFDAVSLSAEVVPGSSGTEDASKELKGGKMVQRRVCERYPGIARGLVRPGGFLVVTSCNWTEEELVEWFTASAAAADEQKDRLVVWGRVEYPRFRFGGREGQGVCTVCFQRVVA